MRIESASNKQHTSNVKAHQPTEPNKPYPNRSKHLILLVKTLFTVA